MKMLGAVIGVLATVLPALAWAMSRVDVRYVHQVDYEKHALVDSMQSNMTNQKLDEIITRVQQMQCGNRVSNGCR